MKDRELRDPPCGEFAEHERLKVRFTPQRRKQTIDDGKRLIVLQSASDFAVVD